MVHDGRFCRENSESMTMMDELYYGAFHDRMRLELGSRALEERILVHQLVGPMATSDCRQSMASSVTSSSRRRGSGRRPLAARDVSGVQQSFAKVTLR